MDRMSESSIYRAINSLQAGKTDEALTALNELDVLRTTSPVACNLAGLIYLAVEQNAAALPWLEQALALDPKNTDILSNLGLALQQLGRKDEALSAYEDAVQAGCARASLYYNRGNLLRESGRLAEAIASFDEALRLDPAYPEAFRAGGLVLRDLGKFESALEFFDEALRHRKGYLDVLIDRGNLLQELARPLEAIASYDEALDIAPGRADILNNRGSALLMLGRSEEASADFSEALRSEPSFPEAWSNRGNLLLKDQQPEDALAAFDQALKLRPNYLEALCGRAVALKYLQRFQESLTAFDAALACDPASPHAKNNKAALLLLLGDFGQGLELYESRWIFPHIAKDRVKLALPEWQGENPAGRRVLVLDEQGLGDAIQFSRYLGLLAERGANVTFLCRKRLHRLFEGLLKPVRVMDRLADEAAFDHQIALSSLPRAFGTRLSTIPAQLSYLHAETALVEKWVSRIGTHGFKIGLCWRGNPDVKADPARFLPLACFEKLGELEGVRLISLQKFPAGMDREWMPWLMDPGEDFDSGEDAFVDSAALMQNLDLIITCDTSVAHLAGALGRPVWVLLKQVPDWRWLLDRKDSPWYPTMQLFRQRRRGDWEEVVERAIEALKSLRASGKEQAPMLPGA